MRRGTPRDKPVAPADQRRFERMRVRKQFGKDFLSEIKQCVQKTDFLIRSKNPRPKPPAKKAKKEVTDDNDDNYPHVKFVITPRAPRAYARPVVNENRPQKTMAPKIEDAEYERRGFGKPTMKDRSDSEKEVLERFDLAQRREAEDEMLSQSEDYSNDPGVGSMSEGRQPEVVVEAPEEDEEEEVAARPKPAMGWRDSESEQFSELGPGQRLNPGMAEETSEQEWNWKKMDQIEVSESEEEDEPSPQKPLSGPTASDRQKQIEEPRRDSAIKRISNGESAVKSLPGVGYEKEDVQFYSQPRAGVQKMVEPELDLSDEDEVVGAVVEEEEEAWEKENAEEDAYSVEDEEDMEKRGSRNQFMPSTDEEGADNVEEEDGDEQGEEPQGIVEYVKSLIRQGPTNSDDETTQSSEKPSDRGGFKFSLSDAGNAQQQLDDMTNDDDGIPVSVDGVVEHSFKFSSEDPRTAAPVPKEPEVEEEDSDSDFGNGHQFFDTGEDESSSEAYEVNAYTDTREEEIRQNRRKDRLIYSTDTA